MRFINEARRILATLTLGTANHAILDYLIKHATGAINAKSWDAIEAHCTGISIIVDKLNFQQGFLAETRYGGIFIGSCSRGYFIIGNRNDAIEAASFYRNRIATQQQHLTHLENLVVLEGWPAI